MEPRGVLLLLLLAPASAAVVRRLGAGAPATEALAALPPPRQKDSIVEGSHGQLSSLGGPAEGTRQLIRYMEQYGHHPGRLHEFMPGCLNHVATFVGTLDKTYTDLSLDSFLRHECKEDGFRNAEGCKQFSSFLVDVRRENLNDGTIGGFEDFCRHYFVHLAVQRRAEVPEAKPPAQKSWVWESLEALAAGPSKSGKSSLGVVPYRFHFMFGMLALAILLGCCGLVYILWARSAPKEEKAQKPDDQDDEAAPQLGSTGPIPRVQAPSVGAGWRTPGAERSLGIGSPLRGGPPTTGQMVGSTQPRTLLPAQQAGLPPLQPSSGLLVQPASGRGLALPRMAMQTSGSPGLGQPQAPGTSGASQMLLPGPPSAAQARKPQSLMSRAA